MGNHIYAGAEWIGSVPEHWKFYKGKFIFGESNEKGNANNLELLSPTQKYGVIPQTLYEQYTTLRTVKIKEDTDLNTFKTVHKGNFCISLRSFQGGFEYSEYEGVVSPAYHILYSRRLICDGYYKYLFKEQSFIAEMNSYCQTLRDGKNISYSDFGKTLIPYPPINEQQAIANYLDDRCSKIDSIIAEAKASIEEYKELKQAVIHEAVTKGLDKNVEMKDSGVEWVEKIPNNWHIVKITRILDKEHPYAIGDGDHGSIKTEQYRDSGIPFIRVQNLGWGTALNMDNVVYISEEDNKQIQNSTLRPNDILFAKTGATIGKTAIMPEEIPIANTTSHVGKISISKEHNSRYIFYVLSSQIGYRQFWDIAIQKTTRPELSIEETKSIKVVLPADKTIEDSIVNYLDEKIPVFDDMINTKASLIEDLEAYKKSLIYEVVTGKRKVVA